MVITSDWTNLYNDNGIAVILKNDKVKGIMFPIYDNQIVIENFSKNGYN